MMAVPAVGLAAHLNGSMAFSLVEGAFWALGCSLALFGIKHAINVVGRERRIDAPAPEVPVELYQGEQSLADREVEVYSCTDTGSFADTCNAVDIPPLSPAPNVPVSTIWGHPNTIVYTPAELWNQALTLRVASGRVEPFNVTSIAFLVISIFSVLVWLLLKACGHYSSRAHRHRSMVATKVANTSVPDHTSSIEAPVPGPEEVSHKPSVLTAPAPPMFSTDSPPLNWFEVSFKDEKGNSMSPEVLQQRALQGNTSSKPSEKKAMLRQQLELLETEKEKLKNQNLSLRRNLLDLEHEKKVLMDKTESQQQQIERLSDKNKSSVGLARQHLDDKERLQEELANARSDANASAEYVTQLQAQLQQADNNVDDSNQQALQCLYDKETAGDELKDAQKKLDIAGQYAESLKEQLADAQAKAVKYERSAKQQQEKLHQIRNEGKVNKETAELNQKEIDNLKHELADTKRKLDEHDLSHTKASERYQMEIDSLRHELTDAKLKLEENDSSNTSAAQTSSNVGNTETASPKTAAKSEQVMEAENPKMEDINRPLDNFAAENNYSQVQVQGQHDQVDEKLSTEVAKDIPVLPTKPSAEAAKETSALPVKSEDPSPAAQTPAPVAVVDKPTSTAAHSSNLATEAAQAQQEPFEFKVHGAAPSGKQVSPKTMTKLRAKADPFMPRGGLGHSRYAMATAEQKGKPQTPVPAVVQTRSPALFATTANKSKVEPAISVQPSGQPFTWAAAAPTQTVFAQAVPVQAAPVQTAPPQWKCEFCKASYPKSLNSVFHRLDCEDWQQRYVANASIDLNSPIVYPPNFLELAAKPGPSADQAEWVRRNQLRMANVQKAVDQVLMPVGPQQTSAVPPSASSGGVLPISMPEKSEGKPEHKLKSRDTEKEKGVANRDSGGVAQAPATSASPTVAHGLQSSRLNDSKSASMSPATSAPTTVARGLQSSRHFTKSNAQGSQQRNIKPLPQRNRTRKGDLKQKKSWADQMNDEERDQMEGDALNPY